MERERKREGHGEGEGMEEWERGEGVERKREGLERERLDREMKGEEAGWVVGGKGVDGDEGG